MSCEGLQQVGIIRSINAMQSNQANGTLVAVYDV